MEMLGKMLERLFYKQTFRVFKFPKIGNVFKVVSSVSVVWREGESEKEGKEEKGIERERERETGEERERYLNCQA